MKRHPIILALGLFFVLGPTLSTRADLTLYAVRGDSQSGASEQMYVLSASTGSILTTISITGLSGNGTFQGLAYNNGVFYATWVTASNGSSANTELISLTPTSTTSATAVDVGNIGGTSGGYYAGIAFIGSTLYGLEQPTKGPGNGASTALVQINTTNASISNSQSVSGAAGYALATNGASTTSLYALSDTSSSTLGTITTTGAFTATGTSGNPNFDQTRSNGALAFDSFSPGTLYGVGNISGGQYVFGTINQSNGTFTSLGSPSTHYGGLAFAPAVPEPSTAVLLLGGAFVVAALRRLAPKKAPIAA
jgi:hypothetical protein